MTWPASDSDQPDVDVRDPLDGNSPLERAEITDSDDLGSTDAGFDPLDDSWDPPDRPSGLVSNPRTPREERGSSFERQLAAEVPDPDPYAEAERREAGPELELDVYTDTPAPAADTDADFDSSGPDQFVEEADGIHHERAAAPGRDTRRPPAEEEALHLDPRS